MAETPPPPGDIPPQSADRGRMALIALAIVLAVIVAVLVVLLMTRKDALPATSPTPTASASATASPSPSPTATAAATAVVTPTLAPVAACGPFGTPLPTPMADTGHAIAGGAGAGCAPGSAPATAFTAPSGWILDTQYTCTGPAGANGMGDVIDFTAHNATTGADLAPVSGNGPWGTQEGGADGSGATAPAGHWVIHVTLPHPDVNQCQWSFQARTPS